MYPKEARLNIDDIIPYERNARHNEKAIPVVAESIREFGFKGAIVLRSREDPTIVNGHTRVAACKSLGWTEFPDEYITYAEDLTDEQVMALRLADNRTGEVATWNRALLKSEMKLLDKSQFDMSRFKFDFKSKKEGFVYSQEVLRSEKLMNLHLVDADDCDGPFGLPRLNPVDVRPSDLIPFNFAKSSKSYDCGVHFCIDDYQFERVWNSPEQYLELLSRFECVCTPNFSVYDHMPYPMKLWNRYRALALGKYWQDNGLKVVADIVVGDDDSYAYCLDGIPTNSTVLVSTNGAAREEMRDELHKVLDAVTERLAPSRVLVYGDGTYGHEMGGAEIATYSNKLIFRKGQHDLT